MSELVCVECLSDSYLQANFAGNDVDECDYCNEERPVVTLVVVVEELEEAIQAHLPVLSNLLQLFIMDTPR